MKTDLIKYAVDNVKHRKLRSWLTIISILIGISAIYALVSFGLGMSHYIDSLGEEMGTDKLMIQAKGIGAPGTDPNFYLPAEDLDFLRKVKGITKIAGMYARSVEVENDREKKYVFSASIPQDENKDAIMSMLTVKVDKGRDLKKGDKLKVLMGYNYQISDKIFKKPLKLNDKIKLNGNTVEVIGFLESIGNPQDDSQVYLSEEGFLELYPEIKNKYAFAVAQAEKGEDMSSLAEKATEKLRKHKGIEEGKEQFFIQTYEELIETFNTVLDVIKAVLVLIALISLVVAGVNITNTMYTAVMERTGEIGVMKAIGARNGDIIFVFLFEAGILGSIGGVLGIGLGYIFARIGGVAAARAGYSALYPIFPWYLSIGCILFAFMIGTIAGIFPARQASKLKPVEALRYE